MILINNNHPIIKYCLVFLLASSCGLFIFVKNVYELSDATDGDFQVSANDDFFNAAWDKFEAEVAKHKDEDIDGDLYTSLNLHEVIHKKTSETAVPTFVENNNNSNNTIAPTWLAAPSALYVRIYIAESGLFSLLINVARAYLYCKSVKIPLIIVSPDADIFNKLFYWDEFQPRHNYPDNLPEDMKLYRFNARWMQVRTITTYSFDDMKRAFSAIYKPKVPNSVHYITPPGATYIGVHIRRGDKLWGEMKPVPMQNYSEAIARVAYALNTPRIFYATDDVFFTKNLVRTIPQFRHFLRSESKLMTYKVHGKIMHGYRQTGFFSRLTHEEKISFFQDLIRQVNTLVRSEYFIGTWESNVARGVLLLRGHMNNSLSLMGEWSPY